MTPLFSSPQEVFDCLAVVLNLHSSASFFSWAFLQFATFLRIGCKLSVTHFLPQLGLLHWNLLGHMPSSPTSGFRFAGECSKSKATLILLCPIPSPALVLRVRQPLHTFSSHDRGSLGYNSWNSSSSIAIPCWSTLLLTTPNYSNFFMVVLLIPCRMLQWSFGQAVSYSTGLGLFTMKYEWLLCTLA